MASGIEGSQENNSVREIHKNGWLKGIPLSEKRHSPFSKPPKAEKVWVAFCIHDDCEPFLEVYENRRSAYSHNPVRAHSLLPCLHVSPAIATDEDNEYEFVVSLGSLVIRLSAPTHEEMIDWIETLSTKLRDLGILQPKDNIYSKEPTSPAHFHTQDAQSAADIEESARQANRDPNSPLPPVPEMRVFNFDLPSRFRSSESHSSPSSPTIYEALYPATGSLPASRRRSASETEETRPRSQRESWPSPRQTGTSLTESSFAPIPAEDGPPAYDQIERTQALPLKEMQAAALKKEMSHKGGLRIRLRKRDCVSGVAFVECFGAVWVAGWKQKEHPLLHNTFHIGDKVLSVAGRKVASVADVNRAIKHQPLMVDFIILRLPYGNVFSLKREYDNQDLGFVREGTTAEIKEVHSNGLAARSGLSAKSQMFEGLGTSNWMLTEVNHRPLNLCFKDNEVQERLNAVGRDISILVQPAGLVLEIKKQLKNMRGYKEYLVQ